MNPIENPTLPESIAVAEVIVREGRPLDQETVRVVADSMSLIGQINPIILRLTPAGPVLVAGYHRLEAVKLLGRETIRCTYMDGDEADARMWEIVEDLHRKELTVLQRAERLAEYFRLREQRQAVVSGQPVHKPQGGRPEGGVAQAARELPVAGKTPAAKRKALKRALAVDSLSNEAKTAAIELDLDDNESALGTMAKESTPEGQVGKAREIANRKRKRSDKSPGKPTAQPVPPEQSTESNTTGQPQEQLSSETESRRRAEQELAQLSSSPPTASDEFPDLPPDVDRRWSPRHDEMLAELAEIFDRHPECKTALANAPLLVRQRFVVTLGSPANAPNAAG